MIITGYNIPRLLGEGVVDPDIQIQPAGVDLTVRNISIFASKGSIDFDNNNREISLLNQLDWMGFPMMELPPCAYLVDLNPEVIIPNDVTAFAQPRSSLTRMGCSISSGFWDSGYRGKSQVLLTVNNPHGVTIYKDARIAQLVFIRNEGNVDKPYDGIYQTTGKKESVGTVVTGLEERLY